ncbi:MAG: hypothetical protein E7Z77_03865 [Methanobrevibacter sp.]|uniref:hypothetical protein n=1 Tax=Methanobrevibacter sp. TaxID=66852 RepID=UPI0025E6C0B4|nr:hypothetical protein [Methanobrevibacter sp.]MBE6508533.1 hypothetical protein [Methanobrevibacter sp.]
MNVFNYKEGKMPSSEIVEKHGMYRKRTPRNKICLDKFIGKYNADDSMDCVNLKKDFKDGVL